MLIADRDESEVVDIETDEGEAADNDAQLISHRRTGGPL